ncbi:MAG: cardiolipin synthase [Firmicutes bacterium]|nr:cardiolipin synthase [Bacillota bacterium]
MPKKNKGLKRFIFTRLPFFILLIGIEIAILIAFFGWLTDYFPYFAAVQTIFAIAMVIYLFNCSMDYSAKLTWLFVIMVAPVPGALFLAWTKNDIGHRTEQYMINSIISETKNIIPQDENVINNEDIVASGSAAMCRYLNNSGCFPIYSNTAVTYFSLGENKFEVMLEELEKAEKFIFMEYFIVNEGYMWGRLLDVLSRKAKQGVDVRVMYDGMCDVMFLSSDYPERMETIGIKCQAFSPIKPFLSSHYNYRDHRKITVIDNKVAFTGGVNLADEYINKIEVYGHWKDTAIMLKGEAVKSLTLMFLQMWQAYEKEHEWDKFLKEGTSVESSGYVMPFCYSPMNVYKTGECIYMDILYRASDYVHIMTPYLILDNELETALKYAAERGVDVKIILPGIPDKKSAYALAKSHYSSLISSGVKIYEYTPGFVHAKMFISDDVKATVGTINLDYRSLYHHFECASYMYKTECIADIEKDFQETLAKCREVTPETIQNETLYYKVLGGIMKIIAPLM